MIKYLLLPFLVPHLYIHMYIYYFYSPAPSAPLNVTAHNLSSTSIMVTWQPPVTPNGIVRFYRVKYDVDHEFSGSGDNSGGGGSINNVNTTNTSVIITMLDNYTTYEVQVFATTITEGDGSVVVRVRTDENSKFLCYLVFICTLYAKQNT